MVGGVTKVGNKTVGVGMVVQTWYENEGLLKLYTHNLNSKIPIK